LRNLFRLIFNYYLVVRNCWFIIMFLVIGYFSLVIFDQGQDILSSLGLNEGDQIFRQTLIVYIAVTWWAWQTFRAARTLLHFSYFNFWQYQPSYALRAQVMVPRILALIPFLILAIGIYKSHQKPTPFFFVLLSTTIWFYALLHFRKDLIVWIRSKRLRFNLLVPDYIPIKNGTYPVGFVWSKQWKWFTFRIIVLLSAFFAMYYFPVTLPQYLSSAAVVLFAFGCWLIIAALLSFLEKYIRFPVSFTVVILVITFSFFNNNHLVRSITGPMPERPTIHAHFKSWLGSRTFNQKDSIDVYLVMIEGGGIRSAYWSTSILAKMEELKPGITDNIYAYSGVSGGSLGATLRAASQDEDLTSGEVEARIKSTLNHDFLAPVTAALCFTDLLQKFLPFPIKNFDRAKSLERSWEEAWDQTGDLKINLSDGFVSTFAQNNRNKPQRLLMLNSTHVESGKRVVISNVNLENLEPSSIIDFFSITKYDVPISTAIGLSSRFPLLTPPGLVKVNNQIWGSLVDGGYYENLGARTMLDAYVVLKKMVVDDHLPIRFKLLAIRNTKTVHSEKPVRGMYETLSPMITFSNIWANTGTDVLRSATPKILANGDAVIEVSLLREDDENIPLGWYLSQKAKRSIDDQVWRLYELDFVKFVNE
jgi:hypothetical protein